MVSKIFQLKIKFLWSVKEFIKHAVVEGGFASDQKTHSLRNTNAFSIYLFLNTL